MIYNSATGEVKLDLSDLAAQYPKNGQNFNQQHLFIALANQDSSFNVNNFTTADLATLGPNTTGVSINANRVAGTAFSGQYLNSYHGQIVSLGKILPVGIPDAPALRQYFAAANYGTFNDLGAFDLIVVPEPSTLALAALGAVGLICRRLKSRSI